MAWPMSSYDIGAPWDNEHGHMQLNRVLRNIDRLSNYLRIWVDRDGFDDDGIHTLDREHIKCLETAERYMQHVLCMIGSIDVPSFQPHGLNDCYTAVKTVDASSIVNMTWNACPTLIFQAELKYARELKTKHYESLTPYDKQLLDRVQHEIYLIEYYSGKKIDFYQL